MSTTNTSGEQQPDRRQRSPTATPARSRDHTSRHPASKDLRSSASRARCVQPEPNRRRATHDDLASAQITITIKEATPGSPLDERLRREQTRALLNLLVDVNARREAKRRLPPPTG
jgi:hypothetical protein